MKKIKEGFTFEEIIPVIKLPPKPREIGLTEVRSRGMGMNQLQDLVENLGEYIDMVKWANGVERLFKRDFVKKKNDYLRKNHIEASTGGINFERIVMLGEKAFYAFLEECKEVGFTHVEISTGKVRLPLADMLAAVRETKKAGLKPIAEVGCVNKGLMSGQAYVVDADMLIHKCEACLEAGAWKVLIEEEGLVENVKEIRSDILFKLASKINIEHLVFEASAGDAYSWFLENFGLNVNLFVDWSQASRLAAARMGISGMSNIWGRLAGFKPELK